MKPRALIGCNLWSINRWLRFTGVRLYVSVPKTPESPTRIGLAWYGFDETDENEVFAKYVIMVASAWLLALVLR